MFKSFLLIINKMNHFGRKPCIVDCCDATCIWPSHAFSMVFTWSSSPSGSIGVENRGGFAEPRAPRQRFCLGICQVDLIYIYIYIFRYIYIIWIWIWICFSHGPFFLNFFKYGQIYDIIICRLINDGIYTASIVCVAARNGCHSFQFRSKFQCIQRINVTTGTHWAWYDVSIPIPYMDGLGYIYMLFWEQMTSPHSPKRRWFFPQVSALAAMEWTLESALTVIGPTVAWCNQWASMTTTLKAAKSATQSWQCFLLIHPKVVGKIHVFFPERAIFF